MVVLEKLVANWCGVAILPAKDVRLDERFKKQMEKEHGTQI